MGTVFNILPFIIFPAIVLISGAIGIYFLVTNADDLVDRYLSLIYSLTNEQSDEPDRKQARNIVRWARGCGVAILLFSLAMTYVAYIQLIEN